MLFFLTALNFHFFSYSNISRVFFLLVHKKMCVGLTWRDPVFFFLFLSFVVLLLREMSEQISIEIHREIETRIDCQ